ncbi:Putative Pal1 cell morphology protein [Penicillium brasilianum]|uniref:Putative Pal1 cell morphology protein n=2 Tax=Penicillium brasilianum TaxID=104259 RepID=A0A0F7TR24_PENBI|nr:Putative Pal1 cell morphology protein [Penicillium brasilianum]
MNAPPALGYPPGVSLAPRDQVSPTAANFGSNNPFRNRALSPSAGSTTSSTRPERPRSTNPFLDDAEALSPQSAPGMSTDASMFSPIERKDMTSNTRILFENLSIKPTPAPPSSQSNGTRPAPEGTPRGPSSRPRPPRERSDRRPAEARSKDPFDIFADPPSLTKVSTSGSREPTSSRRPRRNSESSVMDRSSKLFDDDDEKRRRERRHREREARHRDGKSRSSRKDRRLDIIDKLDVTSIYGTGMFHHDGPFDACNPHRNRKGARTAPMQAFPKGSSNMALGGAGPNNSNIDLDMFHGRGEEAHNDFSHTTVQRSGTETVAFDPTARIDPVHGAESMGLGTSTFLDGAPASRSAIARRQSEHDDSGSGGLQRKKSLAQRLRGKSGTGRPMLSSPTQNNFSSHNQAPMGSSHSASSRGGERNPFFQDYDEEYDKKAARIQESRLEGGGGRTRSSSSPKQSTNLERKSTNDRAYDESKLSAGGGGFLNRMKSLRKPRPERRTSD